MVSSSSSDPCLVFYLMCRRATEVQCPLTFSSQTCKSLQDFSVTRPMYRNLANDLLRRCRALPLKGFQRLTDLTIPQFIRSVNKATRYESAWRTRAPRPIKGGSYSSTGINAHSNYMDTLPTNNINDEKWYKIVSAPPGEEVDWLSPVTSSYTLCATKSGKLVCWDIGSDTCLAQWNPGSRWELWKDAWSLKSGRCFLRWRRC